MAPGLRRIALVALLVLLTLAVALWWRGAAPEPPVIADPDDLDPMVARLLAETTERVRSAPRSASTWAELGMVYQAHRLADEAEACYRQALALDANDAPVWYHLARSLAQRGALEDAVACVDRAIDVDPTYVPLYWQRGEWLLELGRLDEAEAAFRRVGEIDPRELAGAHGVARVRLQQKRYDEAAALLEGVVARRGDDAHGRFLLELAYRGLGRETQPAPGAAPVEVAPPRRDDPWAWYVGNLRTGYAAVLRRTEAWIQAGRGPATIPALLEVRATYGPDARLLNALAGAYASAGRTEDAIRTLDELLEREPGHYRARLNVASMHERKGDLARALASVRRAHEVAQRPEGLMAEGRLLLRMGDRSGAADVYRRAIEVQPDLATAHAGLAVALAGLARFAEARRALDRARQIAPGASAVEQAARRVDELERAGR